MLILVSPSRLLCEVSNVKTGLTAQGRHLQFSKVTFGFHGNWFVAGDHHGNIYHFDLIKNRLLRLDGIQILIPGISYQRESTLVIPRINLHVHVLLIVQCTQFVAVIILLSMQVPSCWSLGSFSDIPCLLYW